MITVEHITLSGANMTTLLTVSNTQECRWNAIKLYGQTEQLWY